MKDLNITISKNIAALRRASKMTQAELAERLDYSDKAVSKWERGEGVPDVHTLVAIAELFETTLDYIVSDHTSDNTPAPTSMKRKTHIVITLLSVLCVWFIALVSFVSLQMHGVISGAWLAFVAAVPTSLTVMLVFNSIWGRMSKSFPIMSLLVWSLLALIFFLLPYSNAWMVFLLGIPLQIGVILWYVLILPVRKRKQENNVINN
ncbi:MAG: helix-turn-helix transcriptional regulator [Clostridia bacterium]|nr:helix-turn-helix transcriptional regulator [Clostridia bacterium]